MFKNGRVEIIAKDQGNRITPSYVAFTADGERLVFKLVDKNSKPHVQVETSQGEKTFAAKEISAMVLVKMKETAEAFLGKKVTHAVVTVPAYFSSVQETPIFEVKTSTRG